MVRELREDRMAMVQHTQQYQFAHQVGVNSTSTMKYFFSFSLSLSLSLCLCLSLFLSPFLPGSLFCLSLFPLYVYVSVSVILRLSSLCTEIYRFVHHFRYTILPSHTCSDFLPRQACLRYALQRVEGGLASVVVTSIVSSSPIAAQLATDSQWRPMGTADGQSVFALQASLLPAALPRGGVSTYELEEEDKPAGPGGSPEVRRRLMSMPLTSQTWYRTGLSRDQVCL